MYQLLRCPCLRREKPFVLRLLLAYGQQSRSFAAFTEPLRRFLADELDKLISKHVVCYTCHFHLT